MAENICNICGANLTYRDGKWVCPACGAYKTEEITNEEVTLLYNAAQKLRMASFDDAEAYYADIVRKYPGSSEGYWGLVLSKYGIKYEDDFDGRKIPTCYATSIESFLTDKNYLSAVSLCKDNSLKEWYVSQAKFIEKIRLEWVEKASREPKYDIFLSFKDSEKIFDVERTEDSYDAAELYTHLTNLGYKVFYSRESLRDKISEKYEPYIFNALNTAKAMIVYGSKAEYFSSTWIKNEWTRYLKRVSEGLKPQNSLIIAVNGFNASELVRPLNTLQCMDASRKTFYGDLEKQLKKLFDDSLKPTIAVERIDIKANVGKKAKVVGEQINTIELGGNIKKRVREQANKLSSREFGTYKVPALTPSEETKIKLAFNFLEKGMISDAEKYALQVLAENNYNGKALIIQLLIKTKSKSLENLVDITGILGDMTFVKKVIAYNERNVGEKVLKSLSFYIKVNFDRQTEVILPVFKEIILYKSETVDDLKRYIFEKLKLLINKNEAVASNYFDALIAVSANNTEKQISLVQDIVRVCIARKKFELAEIYNSSVLQIDEYNYLSVLLKIRIELAAVTEDDFEKKLFDYDNFEFIHQEIKGMSKADADKLLCYFVGVYETDILKGVLGDYVVEWIDVIAVYNFSKRLDFIKNTLTNLNNTKTSEIKSEIFHRVIKYIAADDVDTHISVRISFAANALKSKQYKVAEKYYNEVLKIDESSGVALYGLILSKGHCSSATELVENAYSGLFKDFENLLSNCSTKDKQVSFIREIVDGCISIVKPRVELVKIKNACAVYDKIIKFYPESYNEALIQATYRFAERLQCEGAFEFAEKYYALIVALNGNEHKAYWGVLQTKLKCKNNQELIKQAVPISDLSEFNSAITAAGDNEETFKNYFNVRTAQNDYLTKHFVEQKKENKSVSENRSVVGKVIITFVVVAIVVAIIIFGLVIPNTRLRYEKVSGGVAVYAGGLLNPKEITIPNTYDGKNVVEIADKGFKNNDKLENVIIPSGITSIGESAFEDCENLVSVVIPNTVIYIGRDAFKGCTSLQNVTLSNNLLTIESGAFSNCEKLKTIIIPRYVTKIGEKVFEDCDSLNTIYFMNTSNWYTTFSSYSWDNNSGGISRNVSNPINNVKYFTNTYKKCYWYKIEN